MSKPENVKYLVGVPYKRFFFFFFFLFSFFCIRVLYVIYFMTSIVRNDGNQICLEDLVNLCREVRVGERNHNLAIS